MSTARTTGAVGISNAWRAGWVRTTERDFCFLRLRPALSLATCSSSRLLRPRSRRPPRSRPSPRFASGRRVDGAGAGLTGGAGGTVGVGAAGATSDAASATAGVAAAGSGAGSDAGSSIEGRFFFSGSRSLRSASSSPAPPLRLSESRRVPAVGASPLPATPASRHPCAPWLRSLLRARQPRSRRADRCPACVFVARASRPSPSSGGPAARRSSTRSPISGAG